MDEVRYHNVALDNNYLQTRFNNINSQYAFWNVGSESTQPTTASSTSYTENYSYDLLGNLITKTGQGAYIYAGNTGSSYADPDAATMIGSSTLSYDNNGNLTSSGTHGYQWDYLNRMIGAGNGIATSSYAYDAFSNRVKKTVGTTTTVYPNTLYSQSGNVITRNIFDSSGALVATVNGGTSTSTVYIHPDILGSTNVITNASGQFLEALNYRPFGSTNLDLGTTGNEGRGYIGQIADPESNLDYLNARYYNPGQGQFLSQDPVFLALGSPRASQLTGKNLPVLLANPQSLNSYSYANDNPITGKDPSGDVTLSQLINTFNQIKAQFNSYVASLRSAPTVSNTPTAQATVETETSSSGVTLSEEAIQASVDRTMSIPNDVEHIFGNAEHGLEPLVESLGSKANVLKQALTNANGQFQEDGNLSEVTTDVENTTVVVRGVVLDGLFKVGTVFVNAVEDAPVE
jgi:RHS repeat-associated protein